MKKLSEKIPYPHECGYAGAFYIFAEGTQNQIPRRNPNGFTARAEFDCPACNKPFEFIVQVPPGKDLMILDGVRPFIKHPINKHYRDFS